MTTRPSPGDRLASAPQTERRLPPRAVVWLARLVAAVILGGLVLGSVELLRFAVPAGAVAAPPLAEGPPGGAPGGTSASPDPATTVAAPHSDRAAFGGTILFARQGRIWAAAGDRFTAVTDGPRDSWPVWAPDGQRIWFIRTATEVAVAPYEGALSKITLDYPTLMSAAPDGTDRRPVFDSRIKLPGGPDARYFVQVVQPAISPDGTRFALASDAGNPLAGDVTLSLLPARGGTIRSLGVRSERGLGHNDPAWSPDGKRIAFTYDGGHGGEGTPRIGIYTVAPKAMKLVGPVGLANPAWSPDGRVLVAERTSGKGRNLVVVDATSGAIVRSLTTDGRSFAPTFSPDGTAIAFLHLDRGATDIRILSLAPDATFAVTSDRALTADGRIDPQSQLSWAAP